MFRKIKKSIGKKAEIGQTMTWVVATLIIIIILVIFLIAINEISLSKTLLGFNFLIEDEDSSLADRQMLFAILDYKTETSQKTIGERIIEARENELNNNIADYNLIGADIEKLLRRVLISAEKIDCIFKVVTESRWQSDTLANPKIFVYYLSREQTRINKENIKLKDLILMLSCERG